MKTPICDFVNEYSSKESVRLHMPGHKGKGVSGCEDKDITEIFGADELYHAKGIIRESEDLAASTFGTGRTVFSTEGSSLCIRAMLYLTKLYANERGIRPLVLAARNVHKSFVTSAALLGIPVEWMYSENSGYLSWTLDEAALDKKLSALSPVAFYITSPDYLGNVADIKTISAICKRHGCLLLVDNAHGAYLKFLSPSRHPVDLGADICCDSAHKTLPVLTGGAYLHISNNAPCFFKDKADAAMELFASTSPSYLILQSLDMANYILSDNFSEKIERLVNRIFSLRETLSEYGYTLSGNEPAKLTIAAKPFGYTGHELYELLLRENIVCEFADPDFLVMMFSVNSTDSDVERLERALLSIPKKKVIFSSSPSLSPAKKIMEPQDVIFSKKELLRICDCDGEIFAGASLSCPPAVPLAVYGEEISRSLIECLEYYGITECEIVVRDL